MAYRFDLKENTRDGVHRIAAEQVGNAERILARTSKPDAAVHGARKTIKRIRSLLRLARPLLGEATFHRENARLRDIAHMMSGDRDRYVLIETLTKLEVHFGLASAEAATGRMKQALLKERSTGKTSPAAVPLDDVCRALVPARKALSELNCARDGLGIVCLGLQKSYRAGRRSMRTAYARDEDIAFHDWRKQVQHHWRHMQLLAAAWPRALKVRVRAAKELSQMLGDDHDLSILLDHLAKGHTGPLSDTDIAQLSALCLTRQQELRWTAHPHGMRLFADTPNAFQNWIATCWSAAQHIETLEQTPGHVVADDANVIATTMTTNNKR